MLIVYLERSHRRHTMAEPNTKERILDSAEYLFANKGLKDTSVRDITSQADVHLGSRQLPLSVQGRSC